MFDTVPSKEWQKSDPVSVRIDAAYRELLARVHSAGHLIDVAMRLCGRTYLTPTKGYHFATGAYVEYLGAVPEAERPLLIQ